MVEIDASRWSANRPIRCPHCAHRYAYCTNRPNEPLTFWEKVKWPFGWRPEIMKAPVTVEPDGWYFAVFKKDAIGIPFVVHCERCNQEAEFSKWLACGREPIRFIEHWETMCDCGGEMWSEATIDEQGVRQVCDRCGNSDYHKFEI